jgi:transglutaminase-like putative cysteine protease
MSYDVESVVADVNAAALAVTAEGTNLDPVYHQKADLSPEVEQITRDVVASAVTPYDKALALQNWFRDNFIYDQTVNYSNEADPVQAFIDARAGFCQQFSSTFALMARSLGMASRVAVGFTPGDVVDPKQEGSLVGSDQGGDQSVPGYLVWPPRPRLARIYFDGVGRISFEPTPGRGNFRRSISGSSPTRPPHQPNRPRHHPSDGDDDARDGAAGRPERERQRDRPTDTGGRDQRTGIQQCGDLVVV